VLDIDGAVRAVAHVVIALDHGLRGGLQFLVADPALARLFGRAVEDRMTGVAVALCEAYGCTEIDIWHRTGPVAEPARLTPPTATADREAVGGRRSR
jgi:hypothetical protein